MINEWVEQHGLAIRKGSQYAPVYQQLVDQLMSLVAQGRVKEGDRLPTIKALAEELEVNPNTVARAYIELERRGAVEGHHGGGTLVSVPQTGQAHDRDKKAEEIMNRALAKAAQYGLTAGDLAKRLA